jgi:hypothetical protein
MSEIRVDTISEKTSANGVSIDGVTIKDGGISATTGSIVFNEASADVDFRVESNGQTHMLFVDGGSDHVNIAGGGTDGGGVLNVFSADNTTTLSLIGTDSDASAGPILSLERSANSAATNDEIGKILFKAQNAANETIEYCEIRTDINDATDGSEDGRFIIQTIDGGSAGRSRMEIVGTETIFNQDSADIDFRVESNSYAHCLFVDGGNDRVGVGEDSDIGGLFRVSLGDSGVTSVSANAQGIIIEDNANAGMTIATPNDAAASIFFADPEDNNVGEIQYNHSSNHLAFNVNAAEHFRIASNGDLTATDTSIGSNSDSRLKENIAGFTYDISKFKQFEAKTFDWKNPEEHNGKTDNRGFIAQEVAAIDDYWIDLTSIDSEREDAKLIPADADGNHNAYTLKLGKKDAMYISVIQQLIERIETLEAEVTALKG